MPRILKMRSFNPSYTPYTIPNPNKFIPPQALLDLAHTRNHQGSATSDTTTLSQLKGLPYLVTVIGTDTNTGQSLYNVAFSVS